MIKPYRRQPNSARQDAPGIGFEAVIPNPKLKLMDQVREVMRLRHLLDPNRALLLRLDSALYQIPQYEIAVGS